MKISYSILFIARFQGILVSILLICFLSLTYRLGSDKVHNEAGFHGANAKSELVYYAFFLKITCFIC